MFIAKIYDQHDLQNKTIIWCRYNYPKTFHVEEQCIGMNSMVISECSLYRIHECDEFHKVDIDYPSLFIAKELYANG